MKGSSFAARALSESVAMNRSVLPSTSELHLKKHSLPAPTRKILSDSRGFVEMSPQIKASLLFDMACLRLDLKNLAVALELQKREFRVSESLVSRWRSGDYAELPNGAHIASLGPDFERAYHLCSSRVNGFGKRALIDLVEAVGELAEAVGE
jgi:hypothetical protein